MYDKEKKEYYCEICNWRGKSWWRMQWHYFLHGLKRIPVAISVMDFPSQYPRSKTTRNDKIDPIIKQYTYSTGIVLYNKDYSKFQEKMQRIMKEK